MTVCAKFGKNVYLPKDAEFYFIYNGSRQRHIVIAERTGDNVLQSSVPGEAHVCVCLCVCLCVSVCVYLCLCVPVCVCVYLCASVCVYLCVYISLCIIYVCVCVCVYVSVCVPVCVCLCVCLCVLTLGYLMSEALPGVSAAPQAAMS